MSAIWLMIRELLTSKKVVVLVSGFIVSLLARYKFNVDPEMVEKLIYMVIAYLFAQGAADFKKETAKVEGTVDLVEAGKTPPEAVKEKLI